MTKLVFYIIFFSFACSLFGQESTVTTNVQGKDVSQLKHAWRAQWITHPNAPTLEYGVFLYRRTFDLSQVPNSFIIYVSADNRYRLYVNGERISEGPARSDINNWKYETVDIASQLQKGTNVISVEVINFGEFRHAAQMTFQTALILQGHQDNVVNIDTRPNDEWKIFYDRGFSYTPFVSDSVGGYYAAGPGDILYADKHPWGWKQVDYDDSLWDIPRAATVEFAVGRGFLFGSTWYLVPRKIPEMTYETKRITKVVRSPGLSLPDHIFTDKKGITIPPNTKVSILLDQGYHTIGHPELKFSKGRGAKIKITYAEALFYKFSKKYSAHGGWKKGHRNKNYDQKEIRGYYDIIYPDGGQDRFYSPFGLRTYRFVQFDIQTQDQPLVLDDYYGVYSAYPFQEISSFSTDDDTLGMIWDVAWRTLRNSSHETYIDPYYEQLQYIGDSRVQSMVSIYVSNDDKLMKKAIKSFDDSRLPLGLTASRFPSYIVQVIPTYSLLWIGMMNDYFMYRPDPEFLKPFLPGIKNVLDYFERKIDDTGMPAHLEWWNFTDWAAGFDNGIPPGADDGHSANVALQYVYAIQNALPIFEYFGDDEAVAKYSQIATGVQKAVLKYCKSEDDMLIAERPAKDVYSQHTNIWAVLTNTFAPEVQKNVMEQVLSRPDLIQSSIYFKFYLARALQKAGLSDRYLELLRPWKYMLNQGMTTFGETDKEPRSDCHGWSATPCFDFIHTIAGIQPDAPQFQKVLISPNFGDLHRIDVHFAHPMGIIDMHLEKNDKGEVMGEITLPEGLTGKMTYHSKEISLRQGPNKIKCIK